MAQPKRYSVLRDPVHGDVYLTHEELSLLDTPEVQRLRGIKQLGTAYLVYPGAVHTRFDHSIGALHATQRVIDSICKSAELEPRRCLAITEEEARVVRIAALLHDVTHVPLGHALEDQDDLFPRHDSTHRYQRMLTGGGELAHRLAELGLTDDVLSILLPAEHAPARVPPYWRQLVSGTVAGDILDYLARDAYFTGLHLEVDPRISSYFKIDRASGNLYIDLAKHDLLREDILSEIVRLLEARYYFSERVYYHHAKVAAGAMVARAVEVAQLAGRLAEEDLYDRTDESLLDLLLERTAGAEPPDRERARRLVEGYRARRLVKRACVFPRYENEALQASLVERFFSGDGVERRRLEQRISDLVRFATGQQIDVIVYCPARRMQLKEARIHVRWPGEDELRPLGAYADRVPRLRDLERSYRDLWKLYVFADTRDPRLLGKVSEVAQVELAGAVNAYSTS